MVCALTTLWILDKILSIQNKRTIFCKQIFEWRATFLTATFKSVNGISAYIRGNRIEAMYNSQVQRKESVCRLARSAHVRSGASVFTFRTVLMILISTATVVIYMLLLMTCVTLTSTHKKLFNSSTRSVNELNYTCLRFLKSDSIIFHNWISVHYLTQDEAVAWFSRCLKITMMENCLTNCHSPWQRSPFCEVWKLSQSLKIGAFTPCQAHNPVTMNYDKGLPLL